jgi:hypothetical protein
MFRDEILVASRRILAKKYFNRNRPLAGMSGCPLAPCGPVPYRAVKITPLQTGTTFQKHPTSTFKVDQ